MADLDWQVARAGLYQSSLGYPHRDIPAATPASLPVSSPASTTAFTPPPTPPHLPLTPPSIPPSTPPPFPSPLPPPLRPPFPPPIPPPIPTPISLPQDKRGRTPLMFATESGHTDAVALLLDCSADALLEVPLHISLYHQFISHASPVLLPCISLYPPCISHASHVIFVLTDCAAPTRCWRASPHLQISPPISPYLPSSPLISLHLPFRTTLAAPRCTTP